MTPSLRARQLKEQLLKLKMSRKVGEKDEKSVFGRCPQGDLVDQAELSAEVAKSANPSEPKHCKSFQSGPIYRKLSLHYTQTFEINKLETCEDAKFESSKTLKNLPTSHVENGMRKRSKFSNLLIPFFSEGVP